MQLTGLEPFTQEWFLKASSTMLTGFAASCVYSSLWGKKPHFIFFTLSLEFLRASQWQSLFFGTAFSQAQNIYWVGTAKWGIPKLRASSWNWWIEGLNFGKFPMAVSYASYLMWFYRTISLFPQTRASGSLLLWHLCYRTCLSSVLILLPLCGQNWFGASGIPVSYHDLCGTSRVRASYMWFSFMPL